MKLFRTVLRSAQAADRPKDSRRWTFTALVLATACGSDPPPAPKAPAPPATPTTQAVQAPHVKRPINVSDDIRALCGIPEPKEAPKFEFDNAEITGDDRVVLEALAKCMTTGALKDKSVRLVGRADPRGETEYNMALGAKRSQNAKAFLGGLGIAEARVMSTSRGELDAKGTDEESYRLDRRVDVELVK